MPRKAQPGKQFKVWLPDPLASAVEQDAKDSGRYRAEVIRSILAEHYQEKAREAGLPVGILEAIGSVS